MPGNKKPRKKKKGPSPFQKIANFWRSPKGKKKIQEHNAKFDISLVCKYWEKDTPDGSADSYGPREIGGKMEAVFLEYNNGDICRAPAGALQISVEWMVHPDQVKIVDM